MINSKKVTTIFIVEDNKIFTFALKQDIENAFRSIPIRVLTFETGETCMQRFSEEQPDIIIVDYHLNGRYPDAADGIMVLDWIKDASPETHVIVLTGDDHIDIALKSFQHGASDYVVKTPTQFKKIIIHAKAFFP